MLQVKGSYHLKGKLWNSTCESWQQGGHILTYSKACSTCSILVFATKEIYGVRDQYYWEEKMFPFGMQWRNITSFLPSLCFHQIALCHCCLEPKLPLTSSIFVISVVSLLILPTDRKNSIPVSLLGSRALELNRRSYHLLAKEVVKQTTSFVG